MDHPVIEVDHLTKKFGSLTAVGPVSFDIGEGEIVGLLGPNGAGKTTTIQMLLGLITPTSGTIKIFGLDLTKFKDDILSRTNFSSTYTHLPWRLSVWENLYVVALLYSVKNPGEKVSEVIRIMKLDGVKNQTISELSSGWITRVNLARTLLNNPGLILLDEPTSSLDPESAKEIRTEIINYQKNHRATILWTSHNMAEVEEVCDRVIFLQKGRIIATDTPRQLAKSINICRISFMVESGTLELESIVKSQGLQLKKSDRFTIVTLSEKEIPSFLNALSGGGVNYSEISIEKPTLEDYFLAKAGLKEVTV